MSPFSSMNSTPMNNSKRNSITGFTYPMEGQVISSPSFNSQMGLETSKKAHQIDATQLVKTKLCVFHQQGRCIYGDDCTYSHSLVEMRKAPEELRRTKMCELYLQGRCYDVDCNWAHAEDQLRSKKELRRKSRTFSKPDIMRDDSGVLRRHSVCVPQRDDKTFELMKQLAALMLSAEPEQQRQLQESLSAHLQKQRQTQLQRNLEDQLSHRQDTYSPSAYNSPMANKTGTNVFTPSNHAGHSVDRRSSLPCKLENGGFGPSLLGELLPARRPSLLFPGSNSFWDTPQESDEENSMHEFQIGGLLDDPHAVADLSQSIQSPRHLVIDTNPCSMSCPVNNHSELTQSNIDANDDGNYSALLAALGIKKRDSCDYSTASTSCSSAFSLF